MTHPSRCWLLALAVTLAGATTVAAQTPEPSNIRPNTAAGSAADTEKAAPDALVILFDTGSAAIRSADEATLDQASRVYRDGKPLIMVVTGATDSVGPADRNLRLSQLRANAVLHELVARGIPVERFQVVGKGETDPFVPDQKGSAEPRNRRVEITWR